MLKEQKNKDRTKITKNNKNTHTCMHTHIHTDKQTDRPCKRNAGSRFSIADEELADEAAGEVEEEKAPGDAEADDEEGDAAAAAVGEAVLGFNKPGKVGTCGQEGEEGRKGGRCKCCTGALSFKKQRAEQQNKHRKRTRSCTRTTGTS